MKQWKRPELIIMARSNPEEMILTFCKTNTGMGASSVTENSCSSTLTNPCNYVCADLGGS